MKKTKILIVEDKDGLISRFIGVRTDDFIVYKVSDSQIAQKVFKEIQPDCCIIDLHLPRYLAEDENYEGLALACNLNKYKFSHTRFILISRRPLKRVRQIMSDQMINHTQTGNASVLEKLCAQRGDIHAFFINEETLF